MRISLLPIFLSFWILPINHIQASEFEQAELVQVIRQLESAKQALARANAKALKSGTSERVYFDYAKARQDIDLIKTGIDHYINSNRAQPRNPNQIRTLSGDYDRVKNGKHNE